ncbi:unnamed protein product [Paramecium octaurelia]|uniref:Transmembrane protein n=1 Tax=Paramecium octaurelia TaxID=43137 RepID=A0A8S1RY86_PAROT|nr:unnamed protein product [Paramecium octaurelia]
MQEEIMEVNKSTLMIQQLNRDLLIEMEQQRRFSDILTKQIEFYLIKQMKNTILVCNYTFGLTFLFIYFISTTIHIIYVQRRYKNCILGLVTLTEDLLNDKTNLNLLKRLSK